MSSKHKNLRQLILAAMFLTLALALPFLTGQIPQVGSALCPMHIPVLLCGFFCGPWYALAVGLVAPLLRFALFGMPPLMPTGIAMCFELATYGFVSGLLYKLLPGKKVDHLGHCQSDIGGTCAVRIRLDSLSLRRICQCGPGHHPAYTPDPRSGDRTEKVYRNRFTGAVTATGFCRLPAQRRNEKIPSCRCFGKAGR